MDMLVEMLKAPRRMGPGTPIRGFLSRVVLCALVLGATAAPAKDRLHQGESLLAGEALLSRNGCHELVVTWDGNLVIRGTEGEEWRALIPRRGETIFRRLALQDDHDLALLNAQDGRVVWNSRSRGRGPSDVVLIMQDDGAAVIYSGAQPIWSSREDTRQERWRAVLDGLRELRDALWPPEQDPPPAGGGSCAI
jgi:hypothetical protein